MLKEIERKKSIKTKGGVISITADNVLLFEPNSGQTEMTIEDFEDHKVKFLSLIEEPLPLVSDNRNVTMIGSKEKAFIKNNLHLFASCQALIVGGAISKFLVNTFLTLYQPEVETKSFVNPDDAYEWARGKVNC